MEGETERTPGAGCLEELGAITRHETVTLEP